MTQFLPPNLLALFAARDEIPYLPPVGRLPHEKHTTGYSGVGQYVSLFEDTPPPPKAKVETREERLERRRREKQEQVTYKLEKEIAVWDPNANERATTDPFKTLFIGRVNFDTTESKIRREFESYGPVKKIVIAKDRKTGKPRGYAFVEYEHERDMHSAYKHADGKKIDGKRVLVDVERGRTVKGWLPRRLGGGLGGTRRGGPEVNVKISGREDQDRERFRDDGKRDRHDERRERRDRRDRSTERGEDRRRDRSRDKHREKDRKRSKDRDKDKDKSERKRSRSRNRKDKDKSERKRSRDRDRDKDRDKDKKRRREDREKERSERKDKDKIKPEPDADSIKIKEEPIDDYPPYDDNYDYSNSNHIKSEF